MVLDFTQLPVIDHHCHPFPIARIPEEWERMWTISLNKVPMEDIRNSVFFQMSIEMMRQYHGFPKTCTADELMQHCLSAYRQDPEAYTEQLWEDANIVMLLADIGSPVTEKWLTQEELEEFHSINRSVKIGRINRIERVTDALVKEQIPFPDFQNRLENSLADMVAEQQLVALKSIIAYKTGLEVEPLPKEEVEQGYEAYLREPQNLQAQKIVRDYAFLTGARVAGELGIPLQVHTGAGDSPLSDMRVNNPLLLYKALNDECCKNTDIAMVHAGYPNVEYAAYLVGHYANVYLDVSSMCPYFGIAIEDKLRAILELAPVNKIMYGSDGSGMPDFLWYSAVYFKKALEKTLGGLVEEKHIQEDFAFRAARMILSDNVRRIYRL